MAESWGEDDEVIDTAITDAGDWGVGDETVPETGQARPVARCAGARRR